MNEIKRIFHKKYVLFFLALLLINACVLIYGSRNDTDRSKVYDRLILLADDCRTEGNTYREAVVEAWRIYTAQNGVDNATITTAEKEARAMAVEKAKYLDDYAKMVQERIDLASRTLNSGIYAKDSFENINLLKTRHDLKKLQEADAGISNGIWLERLFDYHYIQIFVLLLLCITVYGFFLERKNGLYGLIHATEKGRLSLFLKRAAILAAESVIASIIFYVESAVILLKLHGGLEGLNALALGDETFFLTSFGLTRLAFWGVMVFLSALFAFALSMMLWLMLSFFGNVNIGLFVFLMLCGIDVLIYFVISSKMLLRFLHYFNIYYLLYPMKALEYTNWGYAFGIISLLDGTIFLAVIAGLATMAGNLYLTIRYYYSGRQNLLERALSKLQEIVMRGIAALPVSGKEVYKILISQRALVILAILCILVANIHAGYGKVYNVFEGAMLNYYERAEGMTYGAELEQIYADYEADYEAFLAQMDKNDETAQRQAANMKQLVDMIRGNVDYMHSQQKTGTAAVVINPYEYEEIYGKKQEDAQKLLALVNILAAIVLSAGFLSYERKSGMRPLAFSCFGRKRWLIRKLLVSWGLIALFEGITYGIYYSKLIQVYRFEHLSAPLKSLPMFADYPINPSILGLIVIDLLMRFVFLAAVSACISAISIRISYLYCVLLGLIATLPQLLYMLGFQGLDLLSIGNYAAFFPLYHMGSIGLNAYKLVFVLLAAGSILLFRRIAQRSFSH